MYLLFTTDNSRSSEGFQIRYESESESFLCSDLNAQILGFHTPRWAVLQYSTNFGWTRSLVHVMQLERFLQGYNQILVF